MTARNGFLLPAVIRRSLSTMTSPVSSSGTLLPMSMASTIPAAHTSEDVSPSTAPHVPIPRNGVDYRGKVVLAPMVRSGELPSRLLALRYGADLVWGPETVDKSMIGTTERRNPRTGCIEWTRISNNAQQTSSEAGSKESIIYRIDAAREKEKLVYQIGTASPTLAVQAASLVAPYVSGIDVNAGCPKPFSTSSGMGAGLLRTPDLLCSILRALVNEVGNRHEIGISVKIRLLETPEKTAELVNALCRTGITGLTVHCRTTPMRPRERAIREQLRVIADICRSHGVACLMNGDVTSREEGIELAEKFGVDGAMIATAAERNPSVFRTKDQGGSLHWKEVVQEYLRLALSVENKFGNTKFLLSQHMPGKDAMYQPVTASRSYSEVLSILGIEDQDMRDSAKAVDTVLGLNVPKVMRKDVKKERRQENDQKRQLKKEKVALQGGGNKSNLQQWQQKAEKAASETGFESLEEGAIAMAV